MYIVGFFCFFFRTWLYWYARGVDNESVSSRTLPKSIGCNKNFTGLAALDSREKISHWLEELCAEVSERLEKDRETVNPIIIVLLFVDNITHFPFQINLFRIIGQQNY